MISLQPIGVIHSLISTKSDLPIQSIRSDIEAAVEVYPQYMDGLTGIEDFSHIYLIYEFHRVDEDIQLMVEPFLDDKKHGVFSTRYPVRPNKLGLSVVRLEERTGLFLKIRGADMLNGTPLLDIKPYIPEFDHFEVQKIGWYQNRKFR